MEQNAGRLVGLHDVENRAQGFAAHEVDTILTCALPGVASFGAARIGDDAQRRQTHSGNRIMQHLLGKTHLLARTELLERQERCFAHQGV